MLLSIHHQGKTYTARCGNSASIIVCFLLSFSLRKTTATTRASQTDDRSMPSNVNGLLKEIADYPLPTGSSPARAPVVTKALEGLNTRPLNTVASVRNDRSIEAMIGSGGIIGVLLRRA